MLKSDDLKNKRIDYVVHLAAMTSVAESLKTAGASNVKVFNTPGHPIVFGEYQTRVDAPTVLVYGHYDVQPPDPIDLWDHPAFEPIIKVTDKHPDGAIFARGSCDDKGQMFMHVKALEAMVSNGDVPCNIKFIIEGEEFKKHAHNFLRRVDEYYSSRAKTSG